MLDSRRNLLCTSAHIGKLSTVLGVLSLAAAVRKDYVILEPQPGGFTVGVTRQRTRDSRGGRGAHKCSCGKRSSCVWKAHRVQPRAPISSLASGPTASPGE